MLLNNDDLIAIAPTQTATALAPRLARLLDHDPLDALRRPHHADRAAVAPDLDGFAHAVRACGPVRRGSVSGACEGGRKRDARGGQMGCAADDGREGRGEGRAYPWLFRRERTAMLSVYELPELMVPKFMHVYSSQRMSRKPPTLPSTMPTTVPGAGPEFMAPYVVGTMLGLDWRLTSWRNRVVNAVAGAVGRRLARLARAEDGDRDAVRVSRVGSGMGAIALAAVSDALLLLFIKCVPSSAVTM
jgi:hypothetical protein